VIPEVGSERLRKVSVAPECPLQDLEAVDLIAAPLGAARAVLMHTIADQGLVNIAELVIASQVDPEAPVVHQGHRGIEARLRQRTATDERGRYVDEVALAQLDKEVSGGLPRNRKFVREVLAGAPAGAIDDQ
jgi:hypothetical protein